MLDYQGTSSVRRDSFLTISLFATFQNFNFKHKQGETSSTNLVIYLYKSLATILSSGLNLNDLHHTQIHESASHCSKQTGISHTFCWFPYYTFQFGAELLVKLPGKKKKQNNNDFIQKKLLSSLDHVFALTCFACTLKERIYHVYTIIKFILSLFTGFWWDFS